jgi:HD-like signal output (HDOD) protein
MAEARTPEPGRLGRPVASPPAPGAGAPRRLLLLLEHPARLAGPALAAALGGGLLWQVETAASPAEARRLLAAAPFDAVVAESRDARCPCAALVRELRATRPATIRVLLCGAEPETTIRALAIAHRVLSAQAHPALVGETVLRVERLHALLDSPRLAAVLGEVEHLPPAPRIYLRLTDALAQDDVGALELADIVGSDPALAAEVLRLSNTAFFSAGRPLTDLQQAVQRLGTRTLRHLVLACEAFALRPGPTAVDPATLQRRALLASMLAPLVLDLWAEAEVARSAALLADIGLLLPPLPAGDGARPPHAAAGAALLAQWGLPEAVVEAVAWRHDPSAAGESRFGLVGAVHVAAALAAGEPVDEDYLRRLGQHGRLRDWRKLASELAAMA